MLAYTSSTSDVDKSYRAEKNSFAQPDILLIKISKIQTKLLLANPYANIEGQRIVVIPQQCKQRRTL